MTQKRFIAKSGLDANGISIIGLIDPVNATDAVTKQFATNATNLTSGTIPAAQMPALTGDITSSQGNTVATLATVNGDVGSYTLANITVNAKGLITAVSSGTPPASSISVTSGDFTLSGNTGTAITNATLATVNSNITAVGSTSIVPVITANAKGLVTSISSATITPAAIGAIATTALGANSGVATLDSTGKLTAAQIPAAIVGAVVYQGTWDASTNTPTLVSSVGTKGQYYKVSIAGTTTIDTLNSWIAGDSIIFDGATWDKIDGSATEVISVAGKIGAVTLTSTDVGLDNVTNVAQLAATQALAITGDITATSTGLSTGTIATTLASVGSAGTYNDSATTTQSFTTDVKGRVTSVGTAVTIAPLFSNIASKPTTLSGYGITDGLSNVTANTSVVFVNGTVGSATLTTAATTANQVIDMNSSSIYRSVNYQVQVTSGSAYQSCTINIIQDGTTAYASEYGDVATGSILATFDADVSGGNLRLLTTPTNAATTFKVIKTLINI